VDQIVLPLDYREKVLELAHTIPLAGHLGKKKTTDRVVQRFYWPTEMWQTSAGVVLRARKRAMGTPLEHR
jgi:cyanate lyase